MYQLKMSQTLTRLHNTLHLVILKVLAVEASSRAVIIRFLLCPFSKPLSTSSAFLKQRLPRSHDASVGFAFVHQMLARMLKDRLRR